MQITNMICDRCTVFVCCLLLFQINWTWHWMSACWCTAHLSPESVINVSRGIHTHTNKYVYTNPHTHTHSCTANNTMTCISRLSVDTHQITAPSPRAVSLAGYEWGPWVLCGAPISTTVQRSRTARTRAQA